MQSELAMKTIYTQNNIQITVNITHITKISAYAEIIYPSNALIPNANINEFEIICRLKSDLDTDSDTDSDDMTSDTVDINEDSKSGQPNVEDYDATRFTIIYNTSEYSTDYFYAEYDPATCICTAKSGDQYYPQYKYALPLCYYAIMTQRNQK